MFNDEQYRRDANAFIIQQQRENEQRNRAQQEREQRENERRDRERRDAEQHARDQKAFEKQQEDARKSLEASFRTNYDNIYKSSSYTSSAPYNYNDKEYCKEQGCIGQFFSLICVIAFYSAIYYFGGAILFGGLIEATQPPRPLPADCSEVMKKEWEIRQKKWEERKQYWYDEYHIKLENVNRFCKVMNQHRINFGKRVYHCWTIVRDRCKRNIRLFFDELNRREEAAKGASTPKRPEIPKK